MASMKANLEEKSELSFLPSLPKLYLRTRQVLAQEPVSPRSESFRGLVNDTSDKLLSVLGCQDYVPVFASGGGTLANDIMLASMVSYSRQPLVLVNGEFGHRLVQQCQRFHKHIMVFDAGWGKRFDTGNLKELLQNNTQVDQIFFTVVETSTGMVNPVREISHIAEEFNIKIGLDAVSALGAEPLDYNSRSICCIASTSGKALASLHGVLIIFVRPEILPGDKLQLSESKVLPLALDLRSLLEARSSMGGIRNTISSILMMALHQAVTEIIKIGLEAYYQHYHSLKSYLLEGLRIFNIIPIPDSDCNVVTSFYKPEEKIWINIRRFLKQNSLTIYDQISYLEKHQIFQIATMGDYSFEDLDVLLKCFKR